MGRLIILAVWVVALAVAGTVATDREAHQLRHLAAHEGR